jgi:hypothetical protein
MLQKFESGRFYRHQNMLDAVIYVVYCSDLDEKSLALCVRWYNNRGISLGIVENAYIRKSDLYLWSEFKQPEKTV